MTGKALLRLGTRGSALALAQTNQVIAALRATNPDLAGNGAIETVIIKTTGDRIQNRTLADQGGKGLFIKEIEEALERDEIDAGVHSAKDVPTLLPSNMRLACTLPRGDARDAFFARGDYTLETLPPDSVIGTASPRRQAMVLALRPDLHAKLLRGNVDTRLRKLDEGVVDATLLAVAGLERLGLRDRVRCILDPRQFVPAAGQGTITLEIRASDFRTAQMIAPAHDRLSGLILEAERAVVEAMQGSCNSPIAAWGRIEKDYFVLDTVAAQIDGSVMHRRQGRVPAGGDIVGLGRQVGRELKAELPAEFFPAA